MKKSILFLLLLGFSLSACSSADNPLINYYSSTCKQGQDVLEYTDPIINTDYSAYNGLTCFSWDATGQTFKMDLVNFGGGCAVTWQGGATLEKGNSLILYSNHEPLVPGDTKYCTWAKCGACIYDWSYEIKGVDTSKDLITEVIVGLPCDDPNTYTTTIPLSSKKQGILCKYTEYRLMRNDSEYGGRLNVPCRDATPSCDTGLTCVKMEPGTYKDSATCLKPCQQDSDCPLDGLLKCTDGFCILSSTWLENG